MIYIHYQGVYMHDSHGPIHLIYTVVEHLFVYSYTMLELLIMANLPAADVSKIVWKQMFKQLSHYKSVLLTIVIHCVDLASIRYLDFK